ncbi:MAG: CoA transferase [Sulfobacillus acidophilus]|uniref:CoA transferase n=1 Tax=Sulfobacillus acidophilus TaxID=53633 RepID=A0A2T2WHT4_9FIRM|nr:MAG: CoA transferase [Sulfobacillus acidophilus]
MTPLRGIRVLDLSRLLPGPWASLMLNDLGAEVIKIENPEHADDVRGFGPIVQGHSALHHLLNRGKKSMTLNLKHDDGRKLFLQLVETADVVLESFRPGVLEGLQLDFDHLRQANAQIVLCSLTGYGQTGPRSHEAGHDINYIGYAGILGLNGNGDRVPIVPSVPIADLAGGSMAVIAILAGLWARQSTQVAQWIDVAMLDGVFTWLPVLIAENLRPGGVDQQTGVLSGGYACYTTYPTQDGRFMCVGALEPKFWLTFCRALKVLEFVGQQFAPMDRQQEMKTVIAEIFLAHSQAYWIERFADVEACCTPVLTVSEALRERELDTRAMVDTKTKIPDFGQPFRWIGTEEVPIDTRTRRLGEDTANILAQIGVTPKHLQVLKERGTV